MEYGYEYLLLPESPSLQGLRVSLDELLSAGWEYVGEVPIGEGPPRTPLTPYHELCRPAGGEAPRGFALVEYTSQERDIVRIWVPRIRQAAEIPPPLLAGARELMLN